MTEVVARCPRCSVLIGQVDVPNERLRRRHRDDPGAATSSRSRQPSAEAHPTEPVMADHV